MPWSTTSEMSSGSGRAFAFSVGTRRAAVSQWSGLTITRR